MPSTQPRHRSLALAFLSALALLAGSPPAHAQTAPAPRVIAYLGLGPNESDRLCMIQLRTALEAAGWSFDGQLALEMSHAGGDPARFPSLARALAASRPAVVLVTDNPPTAALMDATKEVPIIVIGPTNLRQVVDAQLRPTANVTGVTLGLSRQFMFKPMEVLLQAFPQARRIGLITNSDNTAHEGLKDLEPFTDMLRQAGVEGVRVRFSGMAGVAGAWDELARQKVDAVLVMPEIPVYHEEHARQALRVGLPSMSHHSWFASRHGGLLSYGSIGRVNMCARAARYVDQVLRGRPLAELPVEELYDAALVVNLDTAERLGVTLPPAFIARADRVVRPGERTLAPTAEAGGDATTAAQPPTR